MVSLEHIGGGAVGVSIGRRLVDGLDVSTRTFVGRGGDRNLGVDRRPQAQNEEGSQHEYQNAEYQGLRTTNKATVAP